jgi:hypothetical protein
MEGVFRREYFEVNSAAELDFRWMVIRPNYSQMNWNAVHFSYVLELRRELGVDLLLQNKPGIPALKLSKLPSAIAK